MQRAPPARPKQQGKNGGSLATWFPNSCNVPQIARMPRYAQTLMRHRQSHRRREPNRNGLRLKSASIKTRKSRWVREDRVNVLLDGIGRLIAGYLQKLVHGYEPFTPSDPDALRHSLRAWRCAGRGQQQY